jgi:hypothetical protein
VLKLHGSVNWWHGGSNAPLTEQMVYNPRPHARTQSEFLFADLQPFLVPPTSIKNSYYGRSGLVTQWRLAAQALRAADQVDIIGYSFPASDLPTRTFLSSTIRPTAQVRVIDPHPRDGAAESALPGREIGVLRESAQLFAEKYAGTRVSGWYSQQDDGQYLLQIEENGEVRASLIPNTPQPDEELRRRLIEAYGPQEYTTPGGRGPSDARTSTVEVFLPRDAEAD